MPDSRWKWRPLSDSSYFYFLHIPAHCRRILILSPVRSCWSFLSPSSCVFFHIAHLLFLFAFFYYRISPIVVVRLFSFSYPTRSALKDQWNVDESYVKYDISVDISRLRVFVFSLNIRPTIRSEMAVIKNGRRVCFPSLSLAR